MSVVPYYVNVVKLHVSLVIGIVIGASCFAQSADTAGLLRAAASGAADARYAAIDDLGERKEGAELVVPKLATLLQDNDPKVRWRSARSLGDYGQSAQPAVPALRSLLRDKDPIVQYHAAVALGKTGDRSDETIEALVSTVTHSDGRVARAAVAALRSVQPDPKHVVAVLDHMLSSDDQVVVVHALEAVVEHGAKAAPILDEALKKPKTAYLACAAIEHIGPDAAATVPALTELLSDTKHSHLQIQSLLALASIGPAAKSASPQIIDLLEHPTDATVPVAAAYALGAIGASDADKALRIAASKPNALLQMIAAWSLAKIHPGDAQLRQQAMEKLQAGLKSKDPAMQAAAEKGLMLLEESPKKTAAQ
jgi:HEAT repeat protein